MFVGIPSRTYVSLWAIALDHDESRMVYEAALTLADVPIADSLVILLLIGLFHIFKSGSDFVPMRLNQDGRI